MASVAVGRRLVFHSFRSILDPIHPCRPYKRRGNMCKNPQLEKKGFKVLKSTWVDHIPKDRYGNISSDRSLKSSRWFFILFAPFLIKIQICTPCKRKENVQENNQLERNGFQSLKIEDDNNSYDRYGNNLLRRVNYFNSCSSWFSSV